MDKVEVIKLAEEHIPKDFLYGLVNVVGGPCTVKRLMEEKFVNSLKENATVSQLVSYINTKVLPYTRKTVVSSFIASKKDFKDYIRISEDENLNVVDYLYDNVLPYLKENNMIDFGGKEQTIDEIYETILNNSYTSPTIDDYKDICGFILENIDKEVILSDYNGITFKDYILNEVPKYMTSFDTVVIDSNPIELEQYITNLVVKQQHKILLDKDPNRTRENPNLVGEIQLELANNSLSDEEIEELKKHSKYIIEEISVKKKLEYILDAIDNVKVERELNNLLLRVNTLEALSNEEMEYISVIKNRIETKRRSIIKINNNKDDLLVASSKYVEYLKQKIDEEVTLQDDAIILELITLFESRLDELNIKEAMNNKIDSLKSYRQYKAQTIRNATGEYKNISSSYIEINKEFEVIRKTLDYLEETDDLFFDSLVRSLNYKIEDLKATIKASAQSFSINIVDAEKYNQMLKAIVEELEHKNETGVRVRK